MFEEIFAALKDALFWLFELILSAFSHMIDYFFNLITSLFPSLSPSLDALLSIMAHVNYLIPLSYGLTLFFSYYTIKSTVIVIRWILKFTPLIG